MLKYLLITLMSLTAISVTGCGNGAQTNSAANSNRSGNMANTSTPSVNTTPANTPLEPVASPVAPPANVAVLPPGAIPMAKGATPTPGIPSPEEQKRLHKPGATPTPGIPSPAEIQRMMMQHPANANMPTVKDGDVPMKGSPMMKSNKPLGGKPHP